MLNKTTILKKSNSTTYSKGMDIYYSNKIREFAVENDGVFDNINAEVKGSGRNTYTVNIVYDLDDERLEDTFCECPAFMGYNGICKHCVAVLLEYIDYKKRMDAIAEIRRKKETSLTKLHTMKDVSIKKLKQEKKVPVTTPAIKQLLSKHIMKRTLPMVQDSIYGKVRIEPLLTCDLNGIILEFKIGVSYMYVLQDVIRFADALEKNENYSYGQKLKFIHTLESFHPDDRPLI